jgi:hypothetical protein
MVKKAADLRKEVARLLDLAGKADDKEAAVYGKGQRGDELPEDFRFKESRLKRIEEAKRALEEEARVEAAEKQKHSDPLPAPPRGRIPRNATKTQRMARKPRTVKGQCTYAKRKHVVEPVFGQIKEARGFRRFSFRGLDHCRDEWDLVCLTHNLLKLFRHGWIPKPA